MAELDAGVRPRRSNSLNSSSSSFLSLVGARGDGTRKLTLVITGGSGWLGSAIARLAYQHWSSLQAIRLFDSSPPDRQVISGITGWSTPAGCPRVSFHHGDLLDEDSLLTCFAKADVVIHCAGVVERGSFLDRRNMRRVNVEGTQKVVQACLECGVRALVFTGSVAQVQGTDRTGPVLYDEEYRRKPGERLIFSHYGDSKSQAENLVLLADGKEGKEGVALRTCSLRCPVMYGEGDRQVVPSAIRMARRCFGYFLPVGLLSNSGVTMEAVYINNGAWAHVCAARKLLDLSEATSSAMSRCDESSVSVVSSSVDDCVGGKFYFIGDHTPACSVNNFLSQFLRPLGYRVLPFGVPFCLLRVLVFFLELLLILLSFVRVDVALVLNRATLRSLQLSYSVSWERASRELGYSPLFSHKTALAQSMEFYRKVL